jgi:hypothetical protein
MRGIAAVVCALLVGAGTGCSYLFITSVPERHPERGDFACTSSRLAPVIDLALGGILLGNGAKSMFAPGSEESVATGAVSATVQFAAAAVAALAAAHGFAETSACAEAKAELDERHELDADRRAREAQGARGQRAAEWADVGARSQGTREAR